MAKDSSTTHKILALLLLCFGTIVLFNGFERYLVIGSELLTNNRFEKSLEDWQHSDLGISVPEPGSGVAVLQAKDPAGFIGLSQTISNINSFQLLRLSCDLKLLDIPPDDDRAIMARVVLVSNDRASEPVYSRPHILVSLNRNQAWHRHEGIFPVYPDSANVSLHVQFAQTTGTLMVRSLSLRPLAEKLSFHTYLNIALTLWAVAGIWIILPLIKSAIGNTQRTLIMVLVLLVAAGVLMPETLKEDIGTSLFPSLATLTRGILTNGSFQFLPLLRTPDLYKMGHFFLFALLAAVTLYRKPYALSGGETFACLILFAFVTEVLQLFVPGRSALLSDVIIDCAGMFVGLVLLRTTLTPDSSR